MNVRPLMQRETVELATESDVAMYAKEGVLLKGVWSYWFGSDGSDSYI